MPRLAPTGSSALRRNTNYIRTAPVTRHQWFPRHPRRAVDSGKPEQGPPKTIALGVCSPRAATTHCISAENIAHGAHQTSPDPPHCAHLAHRGSSTWPYALLPGDPTSPQINFEAHGDEQKANAGDFLIRCPDSPPPAAPTPRLPPDRGRQHPGHKPFFRAGGMFSRCRRPLPCL